MATEKQKQAARKNIKKAQAARARKAPAKKSAAKKSTSDGMTAASRDRLNDTKFAFPDERKEPLDGCQARTQRDRSVRSGRRCVRCRA